MASLASQEGPDDARPLTPILIVEGNAVAREGLAVVLNDAGYPTAAAKNGREALDYLRAGNRPAMILLDMLMPVMDGWQFLQELRRWSVPLSVPVIVTTGTILTREWAEQNGCCGFVKKPIEEEELFREVERCLRGRP